MMNTGFNRQKRCIIGIILLIILIVLDQFTKRLASTYLMDTAGIDLIPGVLRLQYLENTGMAFSLFEGQMILFYVMTIVLSLAIIWCMRKLPVSNKFNFVYFLFVALLAGAIGNFIDRVFYKYVIDFIYFVLIDFPVFNVADIYVTLSVITLIILIFFVYKDEDFEFLSRKRKSN